MIMDERIVIDTQFTTDKITQSVSFDAEEVDKLVIMERVLQLQEEAVHKALVDLGWTPPSKIILVTH